MGSPILLPQIPLKRSEAEEIAELARLAAERNARRKLFRMYPDTGRLSRDKYRKHMDFFHAGAFYRERCAMAGNRVGKTEGMGCYELTLHLTGWYPHWWKGRRYTRPIRAIAAGKTGKSTRDILQAKLLGAVKGTGPGKTLTGEGLVPYEWIRQPVAWGEGLRDQVDTVYIKNMNGGYSRLKFKSFEQGTGAFEGTEEDVILLDEECPMEVYGEALIRTAGTTGLPDDDGMIMLTFTPLAGMSDVVISFLPQALRPITDDPVNDNQPTDEVERKFDGIGTPISESKYLVNAGWKDVPHIDPKTQRELLASTLPYLRKARMEGIPSLGAGAIYPIEQEEVECRQIKIEAHWPRAYGFDVGWNMTAALWGAWDRENDIVYIYTEHARGHAEPSTHVAAIHARGQWIPGYIDPASRGRSQNDGVALMERYKALGLDISDANNEREAGLFAVYERLVTGRLKIFTTCQRFWAEYRLYRRDDRGQIVKANDHLMDAMRYLIHSGLENMRVQPTTVVAPNHAGISDQRTGY